MSNNRKPNLAELEAQKVECPVCGVKPGSWCRPMDIRDDNVIWFVHRSRLAIFFEAKH